MDYVMLWQGGESISIRCDKAADEPVLRSGLPVP